MLTPTSPWLPQTFKVSVGALQLQELPSMIQSDLLHPHNLSCPSQVPYELNPIDWSTVVASTIIARSIVFQQTKRKSLASVGRSLLDQRQQIIQSFSDAQHYMINKIMGKYAPPLPEVMADNIPGETKAVIDLGCGSGTWYVIPTSISSL